MLIKEVCKRYAITTDRDVLEIGLVMNIKKLGVTEDMLYGIAKGSFILKGGYKVLTHDEIVSVLK